MEQLDLFNDIDKIIDDTNDEIVTYKYTISSYGADYPVDGLVKRLGSKAILIPKFQRSFVWSLQQASRFVESLLLGLPVPGVFLSKESETQKLLVIDGQQRLKSLHMFYEGLFNGKEFMLKGVQENFEGKTYKTLEPEDRIRLDDAIIHATVIKQDEPSNDDSSIYHIFERLNTGGTSLQPQEIRACIYHGKFNELLSELCNLPSWLQIYGQQSKRLKDQELILRYLALYFQLNNYEKPLKEFLNTYMSRNRDLSLQDEKAIRAVFEPTINLLAEVFGRDAFRVKQGIVAAVFDSIMVGLTRRLMQRDIQDNEQLREIYSSLINNEEFLVACRSGTSDEPTVHKRIEMATRYFERLK